MPRKVARIIEPKPMISELRKRSTTRDGPAITMSRSRAIFSYHVLGGGSLAMKSCDWRVCTVNRSTNPSSVGVKNTFGG